MRHVNIPLFIQHMGCPNQCVFCDQRSITGAPSFREEDIRAQIEAVLSTAQDAQCEIAYFGGSFTGIERALMLRLLDIAEEYVRAGQVTGIRMSTRPDYISDEICDILSRYTVSQIELGVQSMSDSVLSRCRRGHTADRTREACRMLRGRGFSFGGQMMVGLPGASAEDETETAREICSLGAASARVYPLLVFADTPLAEMCRQGGYTPLSVEEAVARSADVCEIFIQNGVPILKVGLHETDALRNPECRIAGPYHPAMGELVRGEIYRRRVFEKLRESGCVRGCTATVTVPAGATSAVIGHRGANRAAIIRETGLKKLTVVEKTDISQYNVLVRADSTENDNLERK